jgi:hypothetical protein
LHQVLSQVIERSFEPVLSQAEQFDFQALWKIATEIPREWYRYDDGGLTGLVDTLVTRRRSIRGFNHAFRMWVCDPFHE